MRPQAVRRELAESRLKREFELREPFPCLRGVVGVVRFGVAVQDLPELISCQVRFPGRQSEIPRMQTASCACTLCCCTFIWRL